MTEQQAKFILNCLEYAGEEASLRDKYSGRGLYGKTTVWVVFDHYCLLIPAIIEFFKQNLDTLNYDDVPDFDILREDNMGNQIIIY